MVTDVPKSDDAVAVDLGLDRLDRLQGTGGQAGEQHQQGGRPRTGAGWPAGATRSAAVRAHSPSEAEHRQEDGEGHATHGAS